MKLLAFVLLMLSLCAMAETDVQLKATDPQYGLSQTSNLVVQAQAEQIGNSGNVVLLPITLYQVTDVTGTCTFSNLYGAPVPFAYHVTVSSTNTGQFVALSAFDITLQSTNLGVVQMSTIIAVPGASAYPIGQWAWSAATSDNRYSQSTNQLSGYVQIGVLNTTSNALYGQIVGATNGQTSIVYSNPTSFILSSQVATLAANTNLQNISGTATNVILGIIGGSTVAGYTPTNQFIAGTNLVATNAFLQVLASLFASMQFTTQNSNSVTTNLSAVANANLISASNSIASRYQFGSTVLSNAVVNGINTNIYVPTAGIYFVTNVSGTIQSIGASNQTWLTNGFTSLVYSNPATFLQTNALPGLTNGFVTQSVTNGLATISYVQSQIGSGANTNIYVPNFGIYFITNVSGSIQSINASNQTYLTNGMLTGSGVSNYVSANFDTNQAANVAVSNALVSVTNVFYPRSNPTNFVTAAVTNGLATTNFLKSYSDTNGAAFYYWQLALTNNSNYNVTNNGNWTFGGTTFFGAPGNSANVYFWNDNNNSYEQMYMDSAPDILTFLGNFRVSGAFYGNGFNLTNLLVNSNEISGQINIGQIFGSPTTNSFVVRTNGIANRLTIPDQLIFSANTNVLVDTNVIGIWRGGCGDGTYVQLYNLGAPLNVWTNRVNVQASFRIVLSGGNFTLQSNGVPQYANAVVQGPWTQLAGSLAPAPIGSYGIDLHCNGILFKGFVDSTNLYWQITNAIAQLAPIYGGGGGATNIPSIFAGFGISNVITGNINVLSVNTNSVATIYLLTNYVNSALMGNTPTNGISAITATNIVRNYGSTIFVMNNNGVATNIAIFSGNAISNVLNASDISLGSDGGTIPTFILGTSAIGDGQTAHMGNGNSGAYDVVLSGRTNSIWTLDGVSSYLADLIGGSMNSLYVNGYASSNVLVFGYGNVSTNTTGSVILGNNSVDNFPYDFVWNDGPTTFVVQTNQSFFIHAGNGVAINTNYPGGYALNVYGTVNATNYLLNGVPLLGGTNVTLQAVTNIANQQATLVADNVNLGGMLIGTPTNAFLNSTGTNIVMSIAANSATNAIGNNGGFGTNTTLAGTTFVNNANLNFYYTGTNGYITPAMTSDTTPWGSVFSSSQTAGFEDYKAFDNGSGWLPQGSDSTPVLIFEFPNVVVMNGFSGGIGFANQTFTAQTSLDSNTWVTVISTNVNSYAGTAAFAPIKAQYIKWTLTGNPGSTTAAGNIQISTSVENYEDASNSRPVYILGSGIGINSTNTQGNSVEVGGNLNADTMSINGLDMQSYVQQVVNGYIPSSAQFGLGTYSITGGTNGSAVFNGNYSLRVNPPAGQSSYINNNGEKFGQISGWTVQPWPVGPSSLYAIFNFTRNQFYTNSTLTGTYTAFGNTVPTNSMTITAITTNIFLQSPTTSAYNGGALTNTTVDLATNTISPFAPISGVGQIFIGGPGGTNIYLVMKNSAGASITNKIAFNGQFP